jgi:hypothetical protein
MVDTRIGGHKAEHRPTKHHINGRNWKLTLQEQRSKSKSIIILNTVPVFSLRSLPF